MGWEKLAGCFPPIAGESGVFSLCLAFDLEKAERRFGT